MIFVVYWGTTNNISSAERKRAKVLLTGRGKGCEVTKPYTRTQDEIRSVHGSKNSTFLGILQTIPVSDESVAILENVFTSSEKKLNSLTMEL